jgi:putative transposase
MSEDFRHRNIRLPRNEYLGKKAYFITVCCANRRPAFTSPRVCSWLLRILKNEAESRQFAIYAYCVMADHLHFLVGGLALESDLKAFVKSFKLKTGRHYMSKTGRALWQKKFFDHIVRSSVSLDAVAWYIWMNPVRGGLVQRVAEYPYSGSFTNSEPFVRPPKVDWLPDWKHLGNER